MSGPIALVGSGEYLPVMRPIDRHLLDGRTPRVVMLPTAAGQEGEERVRYWNELGLGHYAALGVEATVLPVMTREDAFSTELAALVEGAGLIYLSGGSPAYLTETLRATPIAAAIITEWERGAALGGCSAGACALTAIAGGFRHPEQLGSKGLGLIDHLAVIPHFDRFDRRSPELVKEILLKTPDDVTLIGIDERTALVSIATTIGVPDEFVVMGEQSVWWIDRDGTRHQFEPGAQLSIRKNMTPRVLHERSRSIALDEPGSSLP
ncbi:MAG TPA: Type 1 glutamine amidotransferase-like domain-containing protein [Acidimicrobiales bacterium]|nr:Type 1 glutamine amidotransferase-like domain-containing protein [Acidimicrobiales bacterium]